MIRRLSGIDRGLKTAAPKDLFDPKGVLRGLTQLTLLAAVSLGHSSIVQAQVEGVDVQRGFFGRKLPSEFNRSFKVEEITEPSGKEVRIEGKEIELKTVEKAAPSATSSASSAAFASSEPPSAAPAEPAVAVAPARASGIGNLSDDSKRAEEQITPSTDPAHIQNYVSGVIQRASKQLPPGSQATRPRNTKPAPTRRAVRREDPMTRKLREEIRALRAQAR